MLRLRPYKSCDAATIASWIREEEAYLKWGGNLFGAFPLSADVIDEKYQLKNGDCREEDNFYPWTAIDEQGRLVGHFIIRYIHGDNRILRFGWVVVDDTIRGKGYGTKMLSLGLKVAFEIQGADKVTIGVYDNNELGHRCYQKVGFRDKEIVSHEPWNIIEMEITKEDYFHETES